ncbi:MAG: PfkB family carbohydrate kinase [Candidatus Dormiibacterota bacterium]
MTQPGGVLVVGSVAQDFVESPRVRLDGELGGSAVYFALAARYFGPVAVIGAVGADRASELRQVLDFADLSRLTVTQEPTYTWRARREVDGGEAETLERFAGGYAGYRPQMEPLEALPRTVFLGSADPELQVAVARTLPPGTMVAGDTMDIFIERQRPLVEQMLTSCRILFATEHELELLARTRGIAAAATLALDRFDLGAAVVKRGAGGAILWTRDRHDRLQAPEVDVIDPTGAGDALAGGMLGRLAEVTAADSVGGSGAGRSTMAADTLLEAMAWGMVTASFAISAPGLAGLRNAGMDQVVARLVSYRREEGL